MSDGPNPDERRFRALASASQDRIAELEQSRLEKERLQLQLQEARKLESLGVLAGGIAHDFNNLLAVISTNVRYARDACASEVERDEALGDVEEAAESAARLVRQLLAYAGRREPEVRRIELSELVQSVTDLLGISVPADVALSLELAPERLCVEADLVQLEQVLMNLVINAAESLGEGPGHVTVRTARVRLAEDVLADWRGGEELGRGDHACLEVEDDGAGMSAEVCERIFDPFFTTKASGHGLGLSAVLGMVQGHRGAIRVQSAPSRGTCIRILLPLDASETRPEAGRRPLVLLAEPDAGFRGRLAELLNGLGARVLEADGPQSALDLCTLHGEELSAALIDASLAAPETSPLPGALRAANPSLPIGLCCGDDAELTPRLRAGSAAALCRDSRDAELLDRLEGLLAKVE